MFVMKDTYYQSLIQELRQLMDQESFVEANQRIDEELRMPYVPKETLKQLEDMKLELKALLPSVKLSPEADEAVLESYLQGSESVQLKLLDSLSQLNARKYLGLIQKALDQFKDPLMKALLIRILIEQGLPDTFSVEMEGIQYRFIPGSLVLPEESDGFQRALSLLNEWCEKEPSLLELSVASLSLKTLMTLPASFDEDEGDRLAYESLKEVYVSLYSLEEFEAFCKLKKIEGISLALLN
jgi:Protein of unknown function (DUF3196)